MRSYGEALALAPATHPARPRMLANRALAFTKAGRYSDALEDADAVVAAAPDWDKGHWRRGTALAGVHRAPDAVAAFHRAWELSKGVNEKLFSCHVASGMQADNSKLTAVKTSCSAGQSLCMCTTYSGHCIGMRLPSNISSCEPRTCAGDTACQKALWGQVQRLTREQLADGIIALLLQLQQQVENFRISYFCRNQCSVGTLRGAQAHVEEACADSCQNKYEKC